VRSGGRIPKGKSPSSSIVCDLNGKVFSEPTTTVLLSLHGAGLLSRHKLSSEQELVLRWPEPNKETEIRVLAAALRGHLRLARNVPRPQCQPSSNSSSKNAASISSAATTAA